MSRTREDRHMVKTQDDTYERRRVAVARGGISPGGVITGVVVAFGSLFLLSALVGGIVANSGLEEDIAGGATDVGVGVGIGLVVAWFLACLWGGYTAGRMGRGAGVANGILVPIVVIVLGLLVGAAVTALGTTANLNLPFSDDQYRLPTEDSVLYELSLGFGIGILAAMLVGGALGGGLGSRWHKKLERRALAEEEERAEAERPGETAPPPPPRNDATQA